jgi:phosphoribosyl-AMP cyclohydrolase
MSTRWRPIAWIRAPASTFEVTAPVTDAFSDVTFGPDGLLPAIVQDATDSTVLMLAYMNREALERTLDTGRTWFWSRSRNEYWCKGETSGNRQFVREVRYDCDGDTVLVLVDQEGSGACHTGERSCFFRTLRPGPADSGPADSGATNGGPVTPSAVNGGW